MSKTCYLCLSDKEQLKRLQQPKITLHKFPNDAKTRQRWFKVCGLSEEVDDATNIKICSIHFSRNDYIEPNAKLLGGRMVLKREAVPSISVPHPPPSSASTMQELSLLTSPAVAINESASVRASTSAVEKLDDLVNPQCTWFAVSKSMETEEWKTGSVKAAEDVVNYHKLQQTSPKEQCKYEDLTDVKPFHFANKEEPEANEDDGKQLHLEFVDINSVLFNTDLDSSIASEGKSCVSSVQIGSSSESINRKTISLQNGATICEQCGLILTSETELTIHCETHMWSRQKRYGCNYCLFKTNCKAFIDSHQKLHTSSGPLFKCIVCHYLARSKATIVKHTRNHIKKKQKCLSRT